MACIRPDGTLTQTGRAVLSALAAGLDETGTGNATGLPIYRVRMVIRALGEAGLIAVSAGVNDGANGYALTQAGQDKLGSGQ